MTRAYNDTYYMLPELVKALMKEMGGERFEEATGRKSAQRYMWTRIGCPIIYGKYLFLKFPHLLTWADYGITCEADLLKYQDFASNLKAKCKELTAQRKAERAKAKKQ